MGKYSITSYANTLPKDVQTKIRAALSRQFKEYGTVYDPETGDMVQWNKCGLARKRAILDDIMSNRLSALEGINRQYYLNLANRSD